MRSIKCVIIGDGAVGKTSLLISYTTNTFPTDYVPTVFDNYTTTISVKPAGPSASPKNSTVSASQAKNAAPASALQNEQHFKLNLWDTAGQEEYDRLRPLSYPQTDIFLICFSVSEQSSFQNVREKWLPELMQHANIQSSDFYVKHNQYPILLVGTKADLRDDPKEEQKLKDMNTDFVQQEQVQKMVQEERFLGYVECSAVTQSGINEIFQTAVRRIAFPPTTTTTQETLDQQGKAGTPSILSDRQQKTATPAPMGGGTEKVDPTVKNDNEKKKSVPKVAPATKTESDTTPAVKTQHTRKQGPATGHTASRTGKKNTAPDKKKSKKSKKKFKCTIL
ncbi:Rho family GTPase RHO5 KNAG_0F01270 [Huiozyma naganishii CBS 8797]|uniref:Uncharacterized protein n=1 Tax=Huiozyma naganishii (strain ATCC MYA-139 / BCRC 22969 / CBS 8797 / KCTC 17520 / NBRC 10181 / NCYC 3082 / Yp74L-3) TaxID=1071383 RepID=J7R7F0_HUIN7|nr:hypothetical protein KNAG_0F01270 [Kazachstania naganishii CBS 8797]CCK70795.1 hypothetical protein KNAG_0F01270 [Kazachstania naganishii CBS 8797]